MIYTYTLLHNVVVYMYIRVCVLTIQGDAIREIAGQLSTEAQFQGSANTRPVINGCFRGPYAGQGGDGHISAPRDPLNECVWFRASFVVPTANEVRPVNKSVKWYIRAIAE